MRYAELYHNGYVELALAVIAAVLVMIFVLAILWAHSERETRFQMDEDARMRALEADHRARIYGDPKENA